MNRSIPEGGGAGDARAGGEATGELLEAAEIFVSKFLVPILSPR